MVFNCAKILYPAYRDTFEFDQESTNQIRSACFVEGKSMHITMTFINYYVFFFYQTEVKMALCSLNDSTVGEIGRELQNQLQLPNTQEVQVNIMI